MTSVYLALCKVGLENQPRAARQAAQDIQRQDVGRPFPYAQHLGGKTDRFILRGKSAMTAADDKRITYKMYEVTKESKQNI